MSAPGPLPWMMYRSVEVGNAARTMAYLLNGVVQPTGGSFEVASSYPCTVLYRVAGGIDPTVFDSPAIDPAPWYHAAYPQSAGFLGLIITEIDGLDSQVVRASSARLGGIEGAQLGPQHMGVRTLLVRGTLVAGDSAAVEYGFRWLTEWLAASNCSQCEKAEVEVYAACPPNDGTADEQAHYLLYDVGLVNGPKYTAKPIIEETCEMRDIEFTLVAENSYLYAAQETCLEAEVVGATADCDDPLTFFLGDPGDPHCCPPTTPPPLGTLGAIITIDSPDGVGGLECGYYSGCALDSPVAKIFVEKLEGGQTLVIDSARRRVRLFEDGETDGTGHLHIPDGKAIEWLEVASCDPAGCFCVRTTSPCSEGAATTVEIKTQLRVR